MAHSFAYIVWFALIVISLPLAMNWVPPNRWYGFRTPATLADPELWRSVNMFSGWALLISALIGLIITIAWPEIVEPWGPIILVGLISIATVVSFFYLTMIKRNR